MSPNPPPLYHSNEVDVPRILAVRFAACDDHKRLVSHMENPSPLPMRLSGKVFAACGLWTVVLGVYFILFRPALLPEDPRFMGTSIEALRAAAPGSEGWLGHVFNVMGGFMVAAGTMTLLIAWRFLARRAPGTLLSLAIAGASGVALMSVTHFLLYSHFRWLLLLPVMLWLVGLICYVREDAVRTVATAK